MRDHAEACFLRVVLSKRELPAAEGIRARHCGVPGRERARLAGHPGPPVRADVQTAHYISTTLYIENQLRKLPPDLEHRGKAGKLQEQVARGGRWLRARTDVELH